MKKFILALMFLSVTCFAGGNYEDAIRGMVKHIEVKTKSLAVSGADQEEIKRQLKDEYEWFWGSMYSKKFILHFVETMPSGLSPFGPYEDVQDAFIKFFSKFVGPEIAKELWEMTGIPAVKEHVIDLYAHAKLIDGPNCVNGIDLVSGDLGWITAFAITMYYTKSYFLSLFAAKVGAEIATKAMQVTDADQDLCNFFHPTVYGKLNEIY